MGNVSWFESWFNSPYYKVLYADRNTDEARDFTDALINFLSPAPHSRMLDIGCGEGRFSIQFAKKGFDVTGIDLAENRIEKALQQENEHLHFYVHDMRRPVRINYFDYAFNLFTSFGYFDTATDNVAAAKAFVLNLKSGGTLVIDYLNRTKVLHDMQPEASVRRGETDFSIRKTFNGTHIVKQIAFTDESGSQHNYTERVSAFGLEDFKKLFEPLGMQLVNTFGSYALDPFSEDNSSRLIVIFKKS